MVAVLAAAVVVVVSDYDIAPLFELVGVVLLLLPPVLVVLSLLVTASRHNGMSSSL